MITSINSWAQGIILAVIISCIIEFILPVGNIKKYIKTVIGIYILFVIIYPLISLISNKKININSIINNTMTEMSEFESSNITIETNSYIEETYRKKIEEDMTIKLKEKGYNTDYLKLYIETESENEYGRINSMVAQISKFENNEEIDNKNYINSEVNTIKNIDIKISNNINMNKKDDLENNISEQEIEEIRKYLNTTYGIDKEKIYLNE